MGILPMSITGVPPVQMPKNMGKMPMRLMGETPMLRRMAFFNGLLGSQFATLNNILKQYLAVIQSRKSLWRMSQFVTTS